jgi:hypothetical protein
MRPMCRRAPQKGRPPRHVRVSNGPKILPDNIGAAPAVHTYVRTTRYQPCVGKPIAVPGY